MGVDFTQRLDSGFRWALCVGAKVFFSLVVPRLLTYVVSRDCLGSRIRGTIYSTRSFLGVFGGVRPVSTAPDRPFAGTGRVEQVD